MRNARPSGNWWSPQYQNEKNADAVASLEYPQCLNIDAGSISLDADAQRCILRFTQQKSFFGFS
jgi:hypothetical protein